MWTTRSPLWQQCQGHRGRKVATTAVTTAARARMMKSRKNTLSILAFMGMVAIWNSPSFAAMAVDRSKFRTCEQTSFCRRHRRGAGQENDSSLSQFYQYEIIKESIAFHKPNAAAAAAAAAAELKAADTAAAAAAAGGGSVWKSLSRRFLSSTLDDNSTNKNNSNKNKADPYVRGPEPVVTATVVNTAATTPTATKETLELSITPLQHGMIRIRMTEALAVGTAYETARVTYDDLVLEQPHTWLPSHHALLITDGTLLQQLIQAIPKQQQAANAEVTNFVALEYGDDSDTADLLLLLQLKPMAVYQFRKSSIATAGPTVSLNTAQQMHFEIRRFKDTNKQDMAAAAAAAAAAAKKKKEEDKSKPEKEIVGYWEDGLAIYADGTREEKSKHDEDEDHQAGEAEIEEERRLSSESESESHAYTSGWWEESFGGHVDTKTYGPMSVGMDIQFHHSNHLFGLPEHAAAAKLQTTIGTNAHFQDPYRLYNLDVFEYELDETMALYGEVPLIVSQSVTTGTSAVFWFNPTETFVDVAEHASSTGTGISTTTHWMSESGVMDIFLLSGPDPATVYRQYAFLTGVTPVPPMFALGYHQCRWNYKDEKDVAAVHAQFEALDYPYDVLWLDIEHTDGKRYFTWDKNLFPNPIAMQEQLAAQGRRMVTIIDPHIKRDDNYYIHKEATSKGLYIRNAEGTADYDGWCWPGSSSYLDFTTAKVRQWWADQFAYNKYQGSTKTLFTWNDMNEPSVFNGPEVSMPKNLLNLEGVEHREWHNLYGMLFHRATGMGHVHRSTIGSSSATTTAVRPFVLSRAFFAGSQKYGAIWTGDNHCAWDHLEIATSMLLSLNTAALSFVGADVGGFFGNPDAELMTRWMQAGAYQPFFRGHAHHDSKRREPWMFDESTLHRLRRASMARYALLPYWYTVFQQAETTGMPVMRMMWMQYPTVADLFAVEDQYMIGSDLLVKPITAQGVTETTVLVPLVDEWYHADSLQRVVAVNATSHSDKRGAVGQVTVSATLDDGVPVFQRGGSIVARKLRLRRSTMTMKHDPYTLYVALPKAAAASATRASGTVYMDDEETFGYKTRAEFAMASITLDGMVLKNDVTVGAGWMEFLPTLVSERMVERIIVMGITTAPTSITVAAELDADKDSSSKGAVPPRTVEYQYDAAKQVLVIRKPDVSLLARWTMTIT